MTGYYKVVEESYRINAGSLQEIIAEVQKFVEDYSLASKNPTITITQEILPSRNLSGGWWQADIIVWEV